jgi:hypothetical protein
MSRRVYTCHLAQQLHDNSEGKIWEGMNEDYSELYEDEPGLGQG